MHASCKCNWYNYRRIIGAVVVENSFVCTNLTDIQNSALDVTIIIAGVTLISVEKCRIGVKVILGVL